jgi:hypothetical protein
MLWTSPSEVARTTSLSESMKRKTSSRPASLDLEAHHAAVEVGREKAPDGGGVGMRGVARKVHALHLGMRASQRATWHALAHWRSMRSGKVLMPRMVR